MMKALSKLKCRISAMRIMYKLLLLYFIIGIVPVTLLSSYMTYTSTNNIMIQHENQVSAENRRVRNVLFHVIYSATNISDTLLYDGSLAALLKKKYSSEDDVYKAYRKYKTVDSIRKNYTEISSIRIYATNDTLFTNGTFVKVDDTIEKYDWYQKVKDSVGKLIWIYDDTIDEESYLHLIRKLPLSKSEDFAIIMININTDYLRFIIDSDTINSILSIDNKISFFSINHKEIGLELPMLYQASGEVKDNVPFKAKYMNKDALSYTSTLNAPKSTSKFQIATFDPLTYNHIRAANLINIRLILINLLIPLFMIIAYSIAFNRRILILRREMNKIANGNLNIIDSFNSYDELGELFKDMQKTIQSIQELNSRIYEEKLLRQKLLNYQQHMEFELLTNQINPHFLYNTLETIRMQLSINKQPEAARIVKQLGKFMRHNIEADNSLVLLTSELDYINIYMDIQHFRYGDRIKYDIYIENDADISEYLILPLLLQPAVENAFVHGLESKKNGGTVTIHVTAREEYLIITVADNGLGMSENKLKELIARINDTNYKMKSHIGMHNVQQRMKLFYGDRYGIKIESKERQSTVITYQLPLRVEDNSFIKNGRLFHEIFDSR